MPFGTNDIDAGAPRGVIPKETPTPEQPVPGFGKNDIDAASKIDIPDGAPWHSPITGAGRTEYPDAPELGTSGPDVPPFSEQGMRMMGAYALSAEPKQIADIAVKTLPGAKQSKDRYGNLMINWKGKRYYVDKPGVSQANLFALLAQAGAFAPSGRIAAVPGGMMKRMAVGGPGAALTSAGLDVAAEGLGAEDGVDYTRAGLAAAGQMGGEFISPVAGWLKRKGRKVAAFFRPYFDEASGTLTEKGRRLAEASGLDPEKMGEAMSREFAAEVREATGEAGARIRGKEFGIRMTRGQATGDVRQLAREEAARHGGVGDDAWKTMSDFDVAQQGDMRRARADIQAKLGGGETRIARPAQAGDVVGPGLTARAAAKKGAVDTAYEAARDVDASISARGFRGLWRRAAQSVEEFGVDPDLHPASTKALRMLRRLESRTRRGAKGGRLTSVTLKRLETERRKLGRLIDAAKNNADRAATHNIKDAFDDWLDEAVDNHLFSGNEDALRVLKAARRENTEYRRMFGGPQSKDRVDKIMQNIIVEDRTPEQVMNYVFGRSKLGSADVSVDVLKRIRNVTGGEGEEWRALKEAAWLKLAKEIGTDDFSPKKFRNRLNDVLDTNRSWMETLFDPDEIAMFERFRDEVMRTVTPERATNPSRSGYTVARLAREWMGRMGTMFTFSGSPVGGAVFFTMKRAPTVIGAARARKAVRPLALPREKMPLFTAASGAGGRLAAPENEAEVEQVQ